MNGGARKNQGGTLKKSIGHRRAKDNNKDNLKEKGE